ncbi:MAG: hypothetical protein EOP34_08030 [Rickettsiales bacterium]|nr:MAG: hypothetical protein EOP34_08030 [Rickettsiales bacterium]
MKHKIIKGVYTALITPFRENKLDEYSFANIIEKQINAKIDGIVLCGSTGEGQTLSIDEHKYILKLGVEIANKRTNIMASSGSCSTDTSIDISKYAESIGVDSLMVSTPSYNRPTQDGLYMHYKMINDSVSIPIIIYNVPIRTSVDISDDNVIRLSKLDNIVGIKDASGNLSRPLNKTSNHILHKSLEKWPIISKRISRETPLLSSVTLTELMNTNTGP